MVTAELCYNPYLQETTARFNEKEPGKNSRVRNYRGSKLADWADQAPEIFREEMNGYDFELSFTGTAKDYELLQKSFAEAGVDGKVTIFPNKTLAERIDKYNKIKSLIGQLRQRINRRFNAVSFFSEYDSRLNVTFYLYMVMGKKSQRKLPWPVPVTAESIQKIESLFETDVANMPLLFYLDSENIHVQQVNIASMLEKSKAVPRQMFFLIDSSLNKKNTERLLKDLRIEKPQIVDSEEDACIEQYVELYPLTDYIVDAVRILSSEFDRIDEEVKNADAHRRIESQDVISTIDDCKNKVNVLKDALDKFENRENIKPPIQWAEAEDKLINKINNWNSRYTIITGALNAQTWAKKFNSDISNWLEQYIKSMEAGSSLMIKEIDNQCAEWFDATGVFQGYRPEKIDFQFDSSLPEFNISEILMGIRTIEGGFYDADISFGKPFYLTYYVNDWRKEALKRVRPVLNNKNHINFGRLKVYSDSVNGSYKAEIKKLIKEFESKRKSYVNNLSSEEKKIQSDYDWVNEMMEQLNDIERR